ncbi:LINE-1 retrotransposable element ORF1 protein [Misgurnus anguillicaudatus]|uniref:LINE-1 retrotransposable element ORF1 protein n=1 Tax=Misgurnus anguillicaudatus TaxID=75329 RepID=UPI003CCFDF95
MKSAADKRKEKEMSRASRVSENVNLHSYSSPGDILLSTPFPESPGKPPSKKGKAEDDAVISTLSQLINYRSDALEKMVGDNALKIEGLKKTVDFVCAELNDIKGKVGHVETRLNAEEKKMEICETRIADLERYSRRWNLRLHGVPEKENENTRSESIRICLATFPEESKSLPDKIDTVHRIGKRLPNMSKPRAIIIQFSSRVMRDGVWRAAKSSEFLRANGFRFTEDLTTYDRERRRLLWPAVEKARKEGKRAHFVGHRAFIEGSEINPIIPLCCQ